MPGLLRELVDAWRGRDLLSQMLDEFQQMMRDGEWMFQTVGRVLSGEAKPEDVHADFFARDKEINRREKDIRRRIVEHLSLRGDADVPACLVLMSVVKDAERVGDYCKNMYEVACLYAGPARDDAYWTALEGHRATIAAMFDEVRRAFAEGNGDLAIALIQEARGVRERCDEMISQLIADTLPTSKAVAYALLSRYYKRVAAHLANICTSVTGPVHEMDHSLAVEQRLRKTYGMKS